MRRSAIFSFLTALRPRELAPLFDMLLFSFLPLMEQQARLLNERVGEGQA